MIGVELTTTDVWTLVAIVLLIVALAFLAMAETALNRHGESFDAGARQPGQPA